MTTYQVRQGNVLSEHRSDVAAIKAARAITDAEEWTPVEVYRITQSGAMVSTCRIWPTSGPLYEMQRQEHSR